MVEDSNKNSGATTSPSLEEILIYEDLAFSSPQPDPGNDGNDGNDEKEQYIQSVARAPFVFCDAEEKSCGVSIFGGPSTKKTILNVEFFGDSSWPNLLLFVHGVCESAETWTVQNLAKICASRQWRMAVLELEGHGLSEGARGVMGTSWSRNVRQVTAFCKHALKVDQLQKRQLKKDSPYRKFVLVGASLGGALAAYASQALSSNDETFASFVGTLLLCPAVGVDPSVVPPPFVVKALKGLSWIAPTIGIKGATPTEDPSHYNCPPHTTRNFQGAWPLGTSKLLLDMTSHRIPNDVDTGELNLLSVSRKTTNHIIAVIAGDKDYVVPINAVRNFVNGMKTHAEKNGENTACTTNIEIVEIKKGDHGLLAQSLEDSEITKSQRTSTAATIESVHEFLKKCETI